MASRSEEIMTVSQQGPRRHSWVIKSFNQDTASASVCRHCGVMRRRDPDRPSRWQYRRPPLFTWGDAHGRVPACRQHNRRRGEVDKCVS
jgi:hypothetical protein